MPMNFDAWAARWQLPQQALDELSFVQWETSDAAPGSEAAVQANVRLKAAALGYHLWRNQNGAARTEGGSWVRFGLANDSPRLNAVLKSSDLIGWRPYIVMPEDIGRTLAVFLSVEVKQPNWKPGRDPRYAAQLRWISLVRRSGGFAGFVSDAEQLLGLTV